MESNENQTLVLHPDSNCSLINNLLENINQYVLKVHDHCLGPHKFPEVRKDEFGAVSYRDSGEISPGVCRLCTATVDGIPLKGKRSRTYGVELAEDAFEYHQSGVDNNEGRSERDACYCSKTPKNIFVKIKNNDKEIVEWFQKTQAGHLPRRNAKKSTIPVKAPFTAKVRPSTSISERDDLLLDLSLERIQDSKSAKEKEGKAVTFKDPSKSNLGTTRTRPVLAEISNILKRMANMLSSCGRSCQCDSRSSSKSQTSGGQDTKSMNSQGSMTNLVVSVNSNSGEEKFVGLSSWNNNKEIPAYLTMSCSRDFNDSNANDIVEILRNRSTLSSSTTYDILSKGQSTSKGLE